MTKEADRLIELCKLYLAGQLNANEYVDSFEQTFWDIQDNLDQEELEFLDQISLENELFEPDADARSEENDLIDEPELRSRVLEHINKLMDGIIKI